jgi:ADP-dependent NAD(P)H-hydrate dehydratase
MSSNDLPEATLVTPPMLRAWRLPEPTGGKEDRGRIVIIGGSGENPGAATLAAEAALRSGAGKLQVGTAASAAAGVAVALPEGLVRGLRETDGGALAADAAKDIADLVEGASSVLVGPGMIDVDQARGFMERLLPHLQGPVVVDALALACVTADVTCLHHLDGRAVLTPNPTELGYTLHVDVQEVERDPAGAALELATRARATVSLGGAVSWIASPERRLWRDESGSAGLGVSGSGDVRAGIVAGLIARRAAPDQAAVWSSYLHGRSGERLAAEVGRLGFLAREIPAQVPRVQAEIDL